VGEIFGQLGRALTKPLVKSPDGSETIYDNQVQPGIGLAHAAARTAEPSAASVDEGRVRTVKRFEIFARRGKRCAVKAHLGE